jgi:DNA mismatch repair protein MutS
VIRAARKRLADLETQAALANPQADLFSTTGNADEPSPDASHPALEALREADPDALSPRDALELLYRVRKLLS